MRLLCVETLLQLASFAAVVSSQATVYITDLPIFSALAPCAGSAVSYVVQGLTQESCAPSVTALESCACTQDQNSAAILARISTTVLDFCHSTAAADVASASQVFSAYCHQATAPKLPTGGPVTEYITDLTAYSNLGGCAQSAVSYAIQPLTGSLCPPAASLLASCACTKDQNSLAISEQINTYIGQWCGTIHTEDSSSAQAVFSGYCGMQAGTTAFPSPSYLAGDVTYYITDLPSYSSLASCAQFAVSYPVMSYGRYGGDCPSAPKGMVSCVCVKDQNSQAISSAVASQAKAQCGTTATEDVSSALGVFAYYCSAGKGLVTPTGVTASVTTTPYGSGGLYSFPTDTSTNNPLDLPGFQSTHIPLGAIIGGAAGGFIFILFILCVGWRYRRRRRAPPPYPNLQSPAAPMNNMNNNNFGKAELAGNSVNAPNRLSKSPAVVRKPTPTMSVVSPVSPMEEKGSPLPLSNPELEGSGKLTAKMEMEAQNKSEVPGGPNAQELHSENARYEVQGQPHAHELVNDPRYEVHGSTQHPVEVPAASANMNEGPFYELEGPYR